MKKYAFSLIFIFITTLSFSQENDTLAANFEFDTDKFLKELSDNACKCIDSISVFDKSKKEVAAEIHACIDKQCGAYQMGKKLASLKNLDKNSDKDIDIQIYVDPNSNEYKKHYYEIETHLMETCPSIKEKVTSDDKLGKNSMSNNPEALKYYNLGIKEAQNENWEKAIDYYKKAVVFDAEFAFAYDNMGVCYRTLGKYDDAIKAYEKSLEIDPNGPMPLQNIGIVYLYKKDFKKAVKAYEKLAKIDPKNPEVYYGLGNIYAQYLFEYEKALDNLCQAYNIYVEIKSPYRSDAEKLIQLVYSQMKKEGKEATFNEILKKHKISAE